MTDKAIKKSSDCKYDTLEYYRLRVRELENERQIMSDESNYYQTQLANAHEVLGRVIHQCSERFDTIHMTKYYPTDNFHGTRKIGNPNGDRS